MKHDIQSNRSENTRDEHKNNPPWDVAYGYAAAVVIETVLPGDESIRTLISHHGQLQTTQLSVASGVLSISSVPDGSVGR